MSRPSRRAVLGLLGFGLTGPAALACGGLARSPAPSPAATQAPAAAAPRRPLTFVAGYKPQANISFAGVYIAQARGYFEEQGLQVEIRHSAGQGEHAKLLAAKRAHVITETATSLVKNVTGEGIPFVSLAILSQRGDAALVSLASSGIEHPRQFEGRTVGYKVFPVYEYLALLKAAGVDRSKIKEVSVGFDVRVLTEKKVDVLPVFKSNEPDLLVRLGFAVNLFDPAGFGVDAPGQIWSTHQELLAADPDRFVRFLKAALRGVAFAVEQPAESVEIVMRYAPQEDRAHQAAMLRVETENAVTEETRRLGLGWQSAERWGALQAALAAHGLIKTTVAPDRFLAASLQPAVYRAGRLEWP